MAAGRSVANHVVLQIRISLQQRLCTLSGYVVNQVLRPLAATRKFDWSLSDILPHTAGSP
jgi:hypothetical protein